MEGNYLHLFLAGTAIRAGAVLPGLRVRDFGTRHPAKGYQLQMKVLPFRDSQNPIDGAE
jgi:hypothetical protein